MKTAIDDLAILPATKEAWTLLYQDEFLLVVNKPAHLLTVPGRHPQNQDCLISRVQQEFPSAAVVHRLDYDTSGLLVLPLTKKDRSVCNICVYKIDSVYRIIRSCNFTPIPPMPPKLPLVNGP